MRGSLKGLHALAASVLLVTATGYADTATVSQDTYAAVEKPTDNFGSMYYTLIRRSSTQTARSYVQFDLSSLDEESNVKKAMLRVFVSDVVIPGFADIYRVTSAWNENTMTGSTQPTLAAPPIVSDVYFAPGAVQ